MIETYVYMKQSFDDSVARLLNAAESLFGDKGFHPTSIRDITSSAKANLAAVNYHFGSKEGLLAAVLARHTDPINQERLRLLESFEAEAGGQPLSVERVLEAFLAPTARFLSASPSFMRFAGRMISEPDPKLRRILIERFEFVAHRFVAALRKSLPDVPEREIWLGFSFVIGAMVHSWTHRADLEMAAGQSAGHLDPNHAIDCLIAFAAAGFRAQAENGEAA